MRRSTVAALAATASLAAPAAAQAHISFHPNTVPEGAFATLTIRDPNESETASVVKLAVQLPDGVTDVSAAPPPGWTFSTKTEKLATPIQTDEGPVTEQVKEITFTGNGRDGRILQGQFQNFPILTSLPGAAGKVLKFPSVETYSDGKVTRWIGPPSSDQPAPTINITAQNGPIQDVAGTEAGPPAASASAAATTAAAKSPNDDGPSTGLVVAALILGALALIVGIVALVRSRRTTPPAPAA